MGMAKKSRFLWNGTVSRVNATEYNGPYTRTQVMIMMVMTIKIIIIIIIIIIIDIFIIIIIVIRLTIGSWSSPSKRLPSVPLTFLSPPAFSAPLLPWLSVEDLLYEITWVTKKKSSFNWKVKSALSLPLTCYFWQRFFSSFTFFKDNLLFFVLNSSSLLGQTNSRASDNSIRVSNVRERNCVPLILY